MSCPDTRIPPEEPPPPARDPCAGPGASFFVTGCLNCLYCGDAGYPHMPERWQCAKALRLCHEARNMPNSCGIGAKFFRDSLIGA